MATESRAMRRYGNPPRIKMAMPTAATAEVAKPVATSESSGVGVPVTATVATAGSVKV